MSQSTRQSELFAPQDWQVLYRAFREINFNASDPGTINQSLRDYIQRNYAEDFSDWIASSEFIAIIDLISWVAGTLAFKTDINARENFLETAEARESVLRLARFLSYNPRRNYPSRGLLKLQQIQTDDDVYDAFGVNLQNLRIDWNNPDDPDWFERFVLILNSAFTSTNPFGIPLKEGIVAGIRSQLYSFNSRFGDATLDFSKRIAGTTMNFEVINTDFETSKGFIEVPPNPDSALHLVYRSDSNGNSSKDTGFFVAFKQGELRYQDVNIAYPAENQVIDLNVDSINESDVWVQTLQDNGRVAYDWNKVPAVFSDNITFNSITPALRTIFAVTTRDRDQVSLRFGDGRFGQAPVGNLRLWYRTSNGLQYQIRPTEMGSVTIEIPYLNVKGRQQYLTLTFSLEEPVSNSSPQENIDDVRRRAPQLYATQNRMVSGEDYNTFVYQSNEARKIKSLVRVYSGHSRFIDLNDPTGTYQDVTAYSDDGIFYKERTTSYTEIPLTDNRSAEDLARNFIQTMLQDREVINVVQDFILRASRLDTIQAPDDMYWYKATGGSTYGTGWFTVSSPFLRSNSTLLVSKATKRKWVNVVNVLDDATIGVSDGLPGPVAVSENLDSGWKVIAILPPYISSIDDEVMQEIEQQIRSTLSFSLWFDYNPDEGVSPWSVRTPQALDVQPQVIGSSLKLFSAEYLADAIWRLQAPGLRYMFESLKKVRFYYDGRKAVDSETRQMHEDVVRVLRYNTDLSSGKSLGRDYSLTLSKSVTYADGYSDPRRIAVVFTDTNQDGYPDDPDTYYNLISTINSDTYLFWMRNSQGLFDPYYDMWFFAQEADRLARYDVPTGTVAFTAVGQFNETFHVFDGDSWQPVFRDFRFGRGRGPNVANLSFKTGGELLSPGPTGEAIAFKWEHYAPGDRRIDPAKTNIIDTFVLTNEYDTLVRQWIGNGMDPQDEPAAPTELALRITFSDFEEFKMFSDDIVWRPVKYKYLFGSNAAPDLKAKFKVVKLVNASLSDGEIKSRILRAISEYFNADFWDFGETFYFTELAAYVHQQLATSVSSFVIVPETATGAFGDGFEVQCRPDELFISTAQVSDITIINSNTPTNLRIR